jgi:hypothetical protein
MARAGTTAAIDRSDAASGRVFANFVGFKKKLTSSCSQCGYKGTMGWNQYGVTSGIAALMAGSIPIGMLVAVLVFQVVPLVGFLIFVPATILEFVCRRYHAQCPRCKTWLMLKKSKVSDIEML